jgi:hypothetical protein
MDRPARDAPSVRYRARPPQVLLGVGAVLLVTAAAALATAYGGAGTQWVLLGAAAVVAGLSMAVAWARLRSSAESLAASSAALALAGTAAGGSLLYGAPATPSVLAVVFLALHVGAPRVVTWPLAAWAAGQVAVLRLLGELPDPVHTEVRLTVALVGLGIALSARRVVARIVLVTTAPWWLAAVVGGTADAWTGAQGARWSAAALMVAAGAGLVVARLRPDLEPLLGPRQLAPLVAGTVAGVGLTGAISPSGTGGLVAAAWIAVAGVCAVELVLTGWRRSLFLPAAAAAGGTVTALCVALLLQDRAWGALSLLLLLVALPPSLVSLLRPAERHVTVPVAVWCLSGSVLLALPADLLTRAAAAVLLAGLYAGAMALGSGLPADVRRPTARAAALTGAAAVVLTALTRDREALAAVLAIQGLATLGWAWRTGRRTGTDLGTADPDDPVAHEVSSGWKVGAAQLVVAGWIWAALLDLRLVEAWTLPLAAGLLLAAGPRLARAPSWPAWGPGLVVALAPSTVWAVVAPHADGWRAVAVLGAATLALLLGGALGVLAPLVVGAATAVLLVLGLAVPALPWPLSVALLVGIALLAVGTLREWRPVAGFRLRLAHLR